MARYHGVGKLETRKMDLTTATAAVAGLKKAMEIVSALSRSDLTVEKAELSLKLADVLEKLAQAKSALVLARDALDDSGREIERLRDAVRLKDDVVRHGDAYFSKGPQGKPVGDPYCTFCFENDGKLFHITDDDKHHTRVCPNCKHPVSMKRSYC